MSEMVAAQKWLEIIAARSLVGMWRQAERWMETRDSLPTKANLEPMSRTNSAGAADEH